MTLRNSKRYSFNNTLLRNSCERDLLNTQSYSLHTHKQPPALPVHTHSFFNVEHTPSKAHKRTTHNTCIRTTRVPKPRATQTLSKHTRSYSVPFSPSRTRSRGKLSLSEKAERARQASRKHRLKVIKHHADNEQELIQVKEELDRKNQELTSATKDAIKLTKLTERLYNELCRQKTANDND